ncbi:hypothetical protein [Spiroplasma litorale]|uniref:hypothetical protein n=1 Tax=Spiroplasma litorale TaxID=216942 RepID=UPI00094675EE|nr:hypothetical protein [Spiroplasma litorale]
MYCIIIKNNYYYVVDIRGNNILFEFNYVSDTFVYIAKLYISKDYRSNQYITLIKVPVYIATIEYDVNYNIPFDSLTLIEFSNLWIYPNLIFNYNYKNNFGNKNIKHDDSQKVVEKN